MDAQSRFHLPPHRPLRRRGPDRRASVAGAAGVGAPRAGPPGHPHRGGGRPRGTELTAGPGARGGGPAVRWSRAGLRPERRLERHRRPVGRLPGRRRARGPRLVLRARRRPRCGRGPARGRRRAGSGARPGRGSSDRLAGQRESPRACRVDHRRHGGQGRRPPLVRGVRPRLPARVPRGHRPGDPPASRRLDVGPRRPAIDHTMSTVWRVSTTSWTR